MTEFIDGEDGVHDLDLTSAECDACFIDAGLCECGGVAHNWLIDVDRNGYYLGYYCSKCGDDFDIPA